MLTSTAEITAQPDASALYRFRIIVTAAVGGLALSVISLLHAAPTSAATCSGLVDHLVVSAPGGFITAGNNFGVSVTAVDSSGNTCTDFTGTARLYVSNTPNISISGQSEVTTDPAINGVINHGVFLTKAGGNQGYGFHRITAIVNTNVNADCCIAVGTTVNFIIIAPATADHLAFSSQPGTAEPAAVLSAVKVSVMDQYENTLNHSGPWDITVALRKGTDPVAGLGGTTTGATPTGIQALREVTFSDLTVPTANTSLFLRATASPILTQVDSSSFDIASTKLALTGSITTSVNTASTSFVTVTLPDTLTAPQSIKLHSTSTGTPTFSGEGTGKPVATKITGTNDYCIAIPTGTTVKFAYKDTVAGSPSINAPAAYSGGTATAPDCTTTANTSVGSSALQVEVKLQGKTLSISGVGFGLTQGSSAVLWGGTPITQLCTAITSGAKVNCITKWSDKSIVMVPPPGDSGEAATIGVRVGDASTGIVSAVSTEADDTFFYGPWVTDVTPLAGSATVATTVTIKGLGLASTTQVNWGDDHPLSKCSGSTKADCFVPAATKITVYGPVKASAGDDAADGTVLISVEGGATKNNLDATFRYALPLITGLVWPISDPLNPKSLTISGAFFAATQGSSAVMWGSTPIIQLCKSITDAPKVSCINKWSDKSIAIVPPSGTAGTQVTVGVRVGDESTGVLSTTSSEVDDSFVYGTLITDITPLTGSTTTAPVVTLAGLGFLKTSVVQWGELHFMFLCGEEKVDCFSRTATKITIYGPLKADAGDDATEDALVTISIPNGAARKGVDTTFRYGGSLITGLAWK
jgi:hypothetical protein